MEFDIGTLIYIIITIIAIVAGVAGKKRKPGQGSTPAGESGSGSFFDRLEEKLGGFVEEAKETVGTVAEEISSPFSNDQPEMKEAGNLDDEVMQEYSFDGNEEREYNEFEGIYDPDQQENLDLITAEAIRSTGEGDALQVIEMDEPNNPDYYEIVSDFDLGTAVIYSTIINRKEY